MIYYKNKEELDYFILNDVSSRDFDIVITKINNLSSSEGKFKLEEVEGRNGDVVLEDSTYKNFKLEIEFAIDATDKDIVEITRNLKHFLHKNRNYQKLILSSDLEHYFEAKYINSLDIEEVINELGIAKLTFSCKPLKKQVNSDVVTITKASTIINSSIESRPRLKIFGTGTINLYINNQLTVVKNVEDFVIVDSEIYECYTEDTNNIKTYLNDKMSGAFPILEEGRNNISWIGNISKVEISTNWVVL